MSEEEQSSKRQKTASRDEQPSPSTIKKANEVFEFMRSKRLSIADFVSAIPYVSGNGRRQEVMVQELFANEATLEYLLLRRNYDVDLIPLTNVIAKKLSPELKTLQQSNPLFGKYETGTDKTKDDLISSSSAALDLNLHLAKDIDKEAPILASLFKQLLSSTSENGNSNDLSKTTDNAMDDTEKSTQSNLNSRLILILSILCYSRNKKKSTNIPVLFGLYLNSLGLTTKRGLQIFNKFGITVNQKTIKDILDDLSRLHHENRNVQHNMDGGTQRKQDVVQTSARAESRNKENSDSLVLPFTQNIISSTNDSYRSTSEAMKISDAKFSQFFDQYTQNT